MILTYSKDRFIDAIRAGTKIHTIRTDASRRWKPGMSIQHWHGNPRNVRQNPYKFADGRCQAVQDIRIIRQGEYVPCVYVFAPRQGEHAGYFLSDLQVEELAKNDGLSLAEFRDWFVPAEAPEFQGRIIHFTDFKY